MTSRQRHRAFKPSTLEPGFPRLGPQRIVHLPIPVVHRLSVRAPPRPLLDPVEPPARVQDGQHAVVPLARLVPHPRLSRYVLVLLRGQQKHATSRGSGFTSSAYRVAHDGLPDAVQAVAEVPLAEGVVLVVRAFRAGPVVLRVERHAEHVL